MPGPRTAPKLTLKFEELRASERTQQALPLRAAVSTTQAATQQAQDHGANDSTEQTERDLRSGLTQAPSRLTKAAAAKKATGSDPSLGRASKLGPRATRPGKTPTSGRGRTGGSKPTTARKFAGAPKKTAAHGGMTGRLRAGGVIGSPRAASAAQTTARKVVVEVGKDVGLATRATAAAINTGARLIAAAIATVTGISASTVLLVAAVVVAVIAAIAVFLPMINQAATEEQTSIGGALAAGSDVPANLLPLYNRAGTLCPEMPAVLLAAQGKQESGFNPNATSPVGAQGIAQFMPGTWATWGQDANGDGVADVFDPADAIQSQAAFMCDLVAQMKRLVETGRAAGDVQVLALSAYNAGPGAIAKYGGVPPYAETQAYAPKILAIAATYGATLTTAAGAGDYAAIIKALQDRLGTPYSWGGGTVTGPSRGFAQGARTTGWDCSSYMQFGFYQGSGGKLTLPRTSSAQAVAFQQYRVNGPLQPGDLLFYGGIASAHHVAMFVGDGKMIEEPRTGLSARITTVRTDYALAARVPLP